MATDISYLAVANTVCERCSVKDNRCFVVKAAIRNVNGSTNQLEYSCHLYKQDSRFPSVKMRLLSGYCSNRNRDEPCNRWCRRSRHHNTRWTWHSRQCCSLCSCPSMRGDHKRALRSTTTCRRRRPDTSLFLPHLNISSAFPCRIHYRFSYTSSSKHYEYFLYK